MHRMAITTFGIVLLFIHACAAATLLVGPSRTYTTPTAAISAMVAGDTMIIDDGTYATTFDIPNGLDGFTIKSASGSPYKCKLDGQGGAPDHTLAWGKGIIHTRSPGTIIGIGFVNGGGSDGSSDGEAGLYAESFNTYGTLNVVNCSFDNNENGIFVPGATAAGQYVDIVLNNCIFSLVAPNGVVSDGKCHNFYISGNSLTSIGSIHYPSAYGNNVKSRSLTTYIADQYNKHDQGRCLDIPSGGNLTIRGGVYTAVGPTAVSNFFEYASENIESGVITPDIDGMTIVGARTNDAIWNSQSSITINFKNTVQLWANSGATFNLMGSVTGIVASPPAGTSYIAVPLPTLPDWALSYSPTNTNSGFATSAAGGSGSTSTGAASSTTGAATTSTPTSKPTSAPTSRPTTATSTPTSNPTSKPTSTPSSKPTAIPSSTASGSYGTTTDSPVNTSDAPQLVSGAILLIALLFIFN